MESNNGNARERRQNRRRGRPCYFCKNKAEAIEYKDVFKLKKFVTDRFKIIPRRISGTCARHQRLIAVAIKRARHLALLPYTTD